MDALFEKLDRLSSPIGTVLDKALARLAPHTTAAANGHCGSDYDCYAPYCGARCGSNPHIAQYQYYYVCAHTSCSVQADRYSKPAGCIC